MAPRGSLARPLPPPLRGLAPLAARPLRLVALAAIAVVFLFAPRVSALDVPPLTGRVVDRAHVLTPDVAARIEASLAQYERDSGQQFALLTVPSLEGDAIEDFSIRVVDQWKLGKKGKDDGLLLLVVMNDHRMRIEVGRGLEGDVTDAVSSRIIRNVLGPAFRGGDYAGGIERALSDLMRVASGKAPSEPDAAPTQDEGHDRSVLPILLFLLVFVPILIAASRGKNRYGGGGGFGGGGFGGFGGGGFGGGGFGGFGGGGFGGGGGGFSGGGGGFGGGGASGKW